MAEPLDESPITTIILGRRAWQTTEELIEAGSTRELLIELYKEGRLDYWERPSDDGLSDVVVWTLTPWQAEQSNVELNEEGMSEMPHWTWRGAILKAIVQKRTPYTRNLMCPERVIDKTPGPDVLVDEYTEEPIVLMGTVVERDQPQSQRSQGTSQGTKPLGRLKGKPDPKTG